MATVRQSITALYEESRKSAVDGAPMMAVIDTVPVADPGLDAAPDTPRQPAIVARFDELRRLAEVEALTGMKPGRLISPLMTIW